MICNIISRNCSKVHTLLRATVRNSKDLTQTSIRCYSGKKPEFHESTRNRRMVYVAPYIVAACVIGYCCYNPKFEKALQRILLEDRVLDSVCKKLDDNFEVFGGKYLTKEEQDLLREADLLKDEKK